jgi:hypothetical protein
VQAPQPWQFGPLTRACRADVAGDTGGADAEQYAAYRYAVRTACKPAALDALDHVVRSSARANAAHPSLVAPLTGTHTQVDAVFWLDIALTFCTGITHEREGVVECVPHAASAIRAC